MAEILLIDSDGVMADFMGHVYNTIEEEVGVSYCHADTRDYWFGDTIHKSLILDIMNREGTYRHLDVITGAVRAVNRLRERYDVRVCSAPPKSSKTAETEKREWLAEHFDMEFAESAIITRDKHLVEARVIVEDNPHIDVPYRVVMFDQPWNQTHDGPRMYGWGDIRQIDRAMR
jgi:5'(3')-deoxyribonucleotidase